MMNVFGRVPRIKFQNFLRAIAFCSFWASISDGAWLLSLNSFRLGGFSCNTMKSARPKISLRVLEVETRGGR